MDMAMVAGILMAGVKHVSAGSEALLNGLCTGSLIGRLPSSKNSDRVCWVFFILCFALSMVAGDKTSGGALPLASDVDPSDPASPCPIASFFSGVLNGFVVSQVMAVYGVGGGDAHGWKAGGDAGVCPVSRWRPAMVTMVDVGFNAHEGAHGDSFVEFLQGPLLEKDEMEIHMHYFPDGAPGLNMISICEYNSLALHQFYMEIFGSGCWSIGHAARSLKHLNWNHFNCVNQWCKFGMIVTLLQYYYVHTQQSSIAGSTMGPNEQAYQSCYCCARSYLIGGNHVEDTVPLLFGLCHRRWTTAPSSLILRFDSGDPLSLSSVKAIQYLQLNAHKPQVHTPERPLRESLTGHQLVWSTKEAFDDCNCSKFEPELSSDKRPLFDSSCCHRYLLCKTRSSRICSVQLSTTAACSFLSFVILYCER